MLFRSDRKSTRLNSSHLVISYAVFCLKKKKRNLFDPFPPQHHAKEMTTVIFTEFNSHEIIPHMHLLFFFFFNDTATTEIYTLSLHDALPIYPIPRRQGAHPGRILPYLQRPRSEEHTSELQSPCNLVCRLLLEKKKKKDK